MALFARFGVVMPRVSVEIEKRKIAGLEKQLRRKHSRVSAGVCRTCENVTSFDIKVTKDEFEIGKKKEKEIEGERETTAGNFIGLWKMRCHMQNFLTGNDIELSINYP